MAASLKAPGRLLPIAGVRLAGVAAGIRYPQRLDLALLGLAAGSRTAAVFTRNVFRAAPVTLARQHLQAASPGCLLINAGNANAGTGKTGETDARACCDALAGVIGCRPEAVLPFSTGVIGERLPVAHIVEALPALVERLDADQWLDAAQAIMTTDTVAKGCSETVILEGQSGNQSVHITGIAKGSGMIRPDMATMLAFIATDAGIPDDALKAMLTRAVNGSFHCITVDGDTSTNDACVLSATGASGIDITRSEAVREQFENALGRVTRDLARRIVRDGEGATKFITVRVKGAHGETEARQVAFTVAHSPLVKTACFAGDPNWGRILAAVGRAGIADLAIEGVGIWLSGTCIVRNGERAVDYTEAKGQAAMQPEDITITVELGRGQAQSEVWTTDLSHDYIRINADYRS